MTPRQDSLGFGDSVSYSIHSVMTLVTTDSESRFVRLLALGMITAVGVYILVLVLSSNDPVETTPFGRETSRDASPDTRRCGSLRSRGFETSH